MNPITLPSGRKIGQGEPPYLIAEVGSNWRSLADCLLSIRQAKLCGADAVKFQLFNPIALYGDIPPVWDMPIKKYGEGPYLPHDWLPALKAECDLVGIEFMCSAFSPELIDVVNPWVNIHKVASAELTHKRMLERLREIGKPVISSTGASGRDDIGMALNVLEGLPVILMYCVAAYPAKVIDLSNIESLRQTFGTLVGYSDHSTDVLQLPMAALAWEACVIEKHVTFIDAQTPDSPHSLNGDEFKVMVHSLRGGLPRGIGPTREEKPMILRHNRRLIATRDIQEGETLQEGVNFGIYRSLKDDTKAMHPFEIDRVKGKPVKRAIRAGDGIAPGDI